MKKDNVNKKQELSLDEEMLMWTSYRYCIGRKTYVNSLASYIGKKYYPLLSDSQAEHTANDIRNCIGDCLHFSHPSFFYDGTVSNEERNPLSDYVTWLTNNVNEKKDLFYIKSIECYKDGYNSGFPKKFDVVKTQDRSYTYIFESDITDLFVWEDLASLMDKKNHKFITVNYNGKEEVIECFKSWRKKIEPIEDQPGYYKHVEWKWERCWKSVEKYLISGEHCGSLNDEYIVNNGSLIEEYITDIKNN